MVKLTKTERIYLNAISDWSAPFEVAERVGVKNGTIAIKMLIKLHGKGLAKFGRENFTYRITDLGLSVLSDCKLLGGEDAT